MADSRRPHERATVIACVSEFEKRGSNESGKNSIGPIAGNTRNTQKRGDEGREPGPDGKTEIYRLGGEYRWGGGKILLPNSRGEGKAGCCSRGRPQRATGNSGRHGEHKKGRETAATEPPPAVVQRRTPTTGRTTRERRQRGSPRRPEDKRPRRSLAAAARDAGLERDVRRQVANPQAPPPAGREANRHGRTAVFPSAGCVIDITAVSDVSTGIGKGRSGTICRIAEGSVA